MSVEVVLARLEGVRSTVPHRWIARCPAHQDKSPSLAIADGEDGRVLLHCFGGCDTEAVLSAIGLTMSDLFPQRLEGRAPSRRQIPASDLLRLAAADITLIAVIVADWMAASAPPSEEHWQVFARAAARVGRIRDELAR